MTQHFLDETNWFLKQLLHSETVLFGHFCNHLHVNIFISYRHDVCPFTPIMYHKLLWFVSIVAPPSLFSFMKPLSTEIWMYVLCAYAVGQSGAVCHRALQSVRMVQSPSLQRPPRHRREPIYVRTQTTCQLPSILVTVEDFRRRYRCVSAV